MLFHKQGSELERKQKWKLKNDFFPLSSLRNTNGKLIAWRLRTLQRSIILVIKKNLSRTKVDNVLDGSRRQECCSNEPNTLPSREAGYKALPGKGATSL